MIDLSSYRERALRLAELLGGQRALARQLGLGHSAIHHRLHHPDIIRLEHVLALEAIEWRVMGKSPIRLAKHEVQDER